MRGLSESRLYSGGFGVLLLVLPVLLLAQAMGAPAERLALMACWFILLGNLALVALLLTVRPGAIWFPVTWFLVTNAAYYGFGPLMYWYGNWETIVYANHFHVVDWESLWQVCLLNLAAIALVLGFAQLLRRLLGVRDGASFAVARPLTGPETDRLWKISLAFLLIGLPIRWLIGLPSHLGLIAWEVPGVFLQLSSLSTLALVPLYLLRGPPADVRAQALFLWLAASELLYGLVSLSKLEILKVLIVLALAATLRPVRFGKLAAYGVVGLLSFAALVPVITYARIAFDVRGLQSAGDLVRLGSDVAGPEAALKLTEAMPKVQVWWARVNYAPAQHFAIQAHDLGSPGSTFELIPWIFVPRLVYPDKPVMTSGKDFNELVNGSRSSQSAPGFFAEGYWNLGWAGVVLVCFATALAFVLFEIYATRHLLSQQLEYLPVILFGIFIGIQQDSWFVPTLFGPLAIGTAYHLMARYFLGPWLDAGRSGQRAWRGGDLKPASEAGTPLRA